MKQPEIMALLQKGRPVVLGEYRRVKAEVIRWRDKQSNRAMEAPSIRYTVETEEETFEVSKFQEVPEGKTPDQFVQEFAAQKPLFNKGQKVVVEIQSWMPQKGVISCRGELHLLENS